MEIEIKEKMTLIEINRASAGVVELLIESGGEITPEIEKLLSDLDVKTKNKIDGYHAMIEKMKSEASYYKENADTLYAVQKACEAVAKRLRFGIQNAMEMSGIQEISGENHRVVLTATPGSLEITDASLIPDEYKMQVTTSVIDNTKIREALDQMEEVPGARIKGGFSIRFYGAKPGTANLPLKQKKLPKPKDKSKSEPDAEVENV